MDRYAELLARLHGGFDEQWIFNLKVGAILHDIGKIGVRGAILSKPSKLDPDVTSQCNTLITMRIKNPDDQRFIAKSTEQLSQADLDELPSLSTGEALISGRSIPAPLLVRVGYKALKHGGESPRILNEWAPGEL